MVRTIDLSTRMPSFKASLFRRHFAVYLLLILVPVLAAAALVQMLVLQLITDDAEKLNELLLGRASEKTEASFESLQTSMIAVLSSVTPDSLLPPAGAEGKKARQAEALFALRERLQRLESHPLAEKAFVVSARSELIVDADLYTDRSYYFRFVHPMDEALRYKLLSSLQGRMMMDLVLPGTGQLAAVASYPFHSADPDRYLVVRLRQPELLRLLDIPERWSAGTALVDRDGELVAGSYLADGVGPEQLRRLSAAAGSGGSGGAFETERAGDHLLQAAAMRFHEGYRIVSLVDLPQLMKPARQLRLGILLFAALFLLVGSVVSYWLSRRIYRPLDSTERLPSASHPPPDAVPALKQSLFEGLLSGRWSDAEQLRREAEALGIRMDLPASGYAFCIRLHDGPDGPLAKEPWPDRTGLLERVAAMLPAQVLPCRPAADTLAIVAGDDPLLLVTGGELAEMIRLAVRRELPTGRATIGVGGRFDTPDGIADCWREAVTAIGGRLVGSEPIAVCAAPERGLPAAEPSVLLSAQELAVVFNRRRTGDHAAMLESALDGAGKLAAAGISCARLRERCRDTLRAWQRTLQAAEQPGPAAEARLLAGLERCWSEAEFREWLRMAHRQLVGQAAEAGPSRHARLGEILSYIHAHYDKELSIDAFAARLNMSPGYFSRVFKEEIGEKYVDYIARYRLEKAKELLLGTDLRIDDIAEKVGYWGRNSFHRVFRKHEGITPTQYRDTARASAGR
ncbi:helix-turn-helix transcriptional regulator [Paenibacillus albicereus]|uniref:Helix-turn-helix transcriptional regulator n=1 Tax=Paenibacillus albicereus TaxID=2726185 RepID=A0A6H2GX36_9BACL|nr:helix-turn-helix domain-containing protein [Paenibacillus albicereus]QJC51919.1 helix-turn-helix transcriptional regulator [Paenibacillus albicereus]